MESLGTTADPNHVGWKVSKDTVAALVREMAGLVGVSELMFDWQEKT